MAMPLGEKLLLARVLLLVVAFRIALWIVPASRIRELAARPVKSSPSLAVFPPEHLAWAVRAAARRVPRATCLTQALALRRLLAKAGHAAEIRIGVAKGKDRELDSHACVVCHGRALVADGEDPGRYSPILSLGAGRP